MEFGTAGLRGKMQAGFGYMNCVTVIQAAQGIARYVLKSGYSGTRESGDVIGYDHRKNSALFARLTMGVFQNFGFKIRYFKQHVPTPFVPFAIRKYEAVCGIMITASHNPAEDNGMKVYWKNGCQIIPPIDQKIAGEIAKKFEPEIWDEQPVLSSSHECRDQVVTAYASQLRLILRNFVMDERILQHRVLYLFLTNTV